MVIADIKVKKKGYPEKVLWIKENYPKELSVLPGQKNLAFLLRIF
jgi:hypothetical protein